ncbi:MAG: hypothetical protein KIT22_01620 [Verrucomicrobiae bacterium]|nr:hypothetical protein [Verrucomicrobiae bacterium]
MSRTTTLPTQVCAVMFTVARNSAPRLASVGMTLLMRISPPVLSTHPAEEDGVTAAGAGAGVGAGLGADVATAAGAGAGADDWSTTGRCSDVCCEVTPARGRCWEVCCDVRPAPGRRWDVC